MSDRTCSVPDCLAAHHAKGFCAVHHARWRRHGDPLVLVIKHKGNLKARFGSKVNRSGGPDSCHPWTAGLTADGYGRFKINGKSRHAHAVAWEIANGSPVPDGMQVDHECHNRAVRAGSCKPGRCPHRRCCNESHLVAKTLARHRGDTARPDVPRGERHSRAKLSNAQVAEIRRRLAGNEVTGRALAREYGVCESLISSVKHRTASARWRLAAQACSFVTSW